MSVNVDIVNTISIGLTALATLILAICAVLALRSWKREFCYKNKYEYSYRFLIGFYDYIDYISEKMSLIQDKEEFKKANKKLQELASPINLNYFPLKKLYRKETDEIFSNMFKIVVRYRSMLEDNLFSEGDNLEEEPKKSELLNYINDFKYNKLYPLIENELEK